jgi:SAM-dependent methyltransferase
MTLAFDAVAGTLEGLRGTGSFHPTMTLASTDGVVMPLEVGTWLGRPGRAEAELLDRAVGPVLDVGCGPGRHTIELLRRGIPAVGLDISPRAVRLAARRGAPALLGSVFDPVSGEGTWGTVLLLDGNIGIGGHPPALLRRARRLLRPDGRLLVEALPPGAPTRSVRVRVHVDRRAASRPFPWAVVGVLDLPGLAARGGFRVRELMEGDGRWFARLDAA